MKITFTQDKFTPGTARFAEEGPRDQHVVGTLYVRKTSPLSLCKRLVVTIESGDKEVEK